MVIWNAFPFTSSVPGLRFLTQKFWASPQRDGSHGLLVSLQSVNITLRYNIIKWTILFTALSNILNSKRSETENRKQWLYYLYLFFVMYQGMILSKVQTEGSHGLLVSVQSVNTCV